MSIQFNFISIKGKSGPHKINIKNLQVHPQKTVSKYGRKVH